MEIKEIIDNLMNNEENSKYFVHRTKIAPLWIDISNGKFCTAKEYDNLYKTLGDDYVVENLYTLKEFEDYWKEDILDVEMGWSVSRQEYNEAYKKNLEEELNNFFGKGIYAVESSIERTATPLEKGANHQILSIDEQKKRLSTILQQEGFGFNTGKSNALLGFLANREELDTVLILEIPRKCFSSLDDITPLFQKTDEILEIPTAYRGVQKLDTVIPKEYIKGAFNLDGKDVHFLDNENYKENIILKDGIYNNQTIEKILENLKNSQDISDTEIEKLLGIIRDDFNADKDIDKCKSRISFINDNLLSKIDDKEQYDRLSLIIEQLSEQIKNPLEKAYNRILKSDFKELSTDEVMEQIESLISNGSRILENFKEQRNWTKFYKMIEIYQEGLQILNKNGLEKLKSDYRFNYASALVKGKLSDMNDLEMLNQEDQNLEDIMTLFGELEERDKKEYERRLEENSKKRETTMDKICEDTIEENPQYYLFSSDEIGKATIDRKTTKKDKAQNQEKQDEQEVFKVKEDESQLD